MSRILIVEDEKLLGKSLAASLENDGHRAQWLASAEEAVAWLENDQADLALIDCRLPGMSGIEFLEWLVPSHPDTIAIMMTAHADAPTAVQAMKAGAVDFLVKPVDLVAVSLLAQNNLNHRRISQAWKHEQKARVQKYGLHQVISECDRMEAAKSLVRRLSTLCAAGSGRPPNVLITGETGSGKDVFARAIHYEGPRRGGPFMHVNCAALPESLTESELFGHVKGAFTDASSSKRGLFELADGGTLFLDEIGAMPLGSQAKVLTAIDTGRIRQVGGTKEVAVDVHIIAAMNQDPQCLVSDGKLREDLYHRLRVMHIELPPLRERGGDLEVLADHFIRGYCRKFAVEVKKLSPAGRFALRQYDWPGNVRELSHCLESAVLLSGEVIGADCIPVPGNGRCRWASGRPKACIPLDFSRGPIPFEGVERELLTQAMAAANNNISRAAELLDLSRDTFRDRLEKHGLDSEGNGAAS